ncbi:formyltransferase family protein [Vibrio cholerae]|uniref:formyltransferase family protein n=1 Tax=Vibrio cholerae TaxID=666 RepID=UPI00115B206D|nr:formyltransferase family protein [Vibrio cholerae]TQP74569.1 formyl transferase [Vibrio cholerae]
MKVIVAGKNNIAIDVVKALLYRPEVNEVFAIFNTNDNGIDGFQRSFKKFCLINGIKSLSLSEAYECENSLFLSLEFDKIVDPNRFSHKNIYNIHFSLLPKYKGMYTSAWPIINGESTSGVTFHCIDRGIDTGDIIFQEEFTLGEHETAKSLYQKYIDTGTALVLRNLKNILSGDLIKRPQVAEKSSYYSKKSIDYSNIKIDFNKTAFQVKKQIDAFTFRDYQLPNINGRKVCGVEISGNKSKDKPGSLSEDDVKFMISTVDFDILVYKDFFDELLISIEENDVQSFLKYVNFFNVNEKNVKGWSPIIVAAYHGRIDMIKELLSLGANINDRNINGTTVFMYAKDFAINNNEYSILNQIIELGADVKIKDNNGFDVFDYVNKSGDIDAVEKMRVFK